MLFFKAEQIHLITGAKIKVTITNGDTGKTVKYDSSNTLIRNAAIQCGESSLPTRELNRIQNTVNTPKKVTRSRATIDKMVVQNLPGKKKTPPVKPHKKVTGKCKVCSIIYESAKDKAFRKKRIRQTTWIGCERPGCKYWAHACCAKVTFKPGKKVEDHDILCPDHRS